MKILLVTTYFEPDSGAAAVRLSRLARLLHARGHEITVLTTMPHYPQGRIAQSYRGKFTVTEELDDIRVIRTWLYATPSRRISKRLISQISFMFTAALRGLILPRPDVFLIEAQPVFTNFAGTFLSILKRRPVVLNVSDLWPDHLVSTGALTEKHLIYRVARQLVDGTYRMAAGITTVSAILAEKIKGYIQPPHDKVQVIYNGVDLKRFNPANDGDSFRTEFNLDKRKIVSFISTFTTPYDFDTMLAVAEHFKNLDDVQFIFVGGGSQSDVVEARLNRGDLPNVHWLGWIDFALIPAAWAASDVTFLALHDHDLYRGTIPAKYYEVMASGVPIVAAIEGVAARMLEESGAGIAVHCGDVDGLITNITHLLNNPQQREQHGKAGRAYAEANFDPERVATAYEDMLKTAIGEG